MTDGKSFPFWLLRTTGTNRLTDKIGVGDKYSVSVKLADMLSVVTYADSPVNLTFYQIFLFSLIIIALLC